MNPIDLTDPITFEQWVTFFQLALGGTSARDVSYDIAIASADVIAQKAVALVQQRAAARRP